MYCYSKTYRIIALSMALLMFATSMSFAIDMHYCGGELKNFSLFGKAKACHEAKNATTVMKNCPHHKKMMQDQKEASLEKKDCCENRTLHFQVDQDFDKQILDLSVNKVAQSPVNTVDASFSMFIFQEQEILAYKYKPPLIAKNIPILIQSFLL